jgi:hypothetical protein
LGKDGRRGLSVQPAQLERVEARRLKKGVVATASGEHDRDALVHQSPGSEEQRVTRGCVEPVRVIDAAQHGGALSGFGEHRQRCDGDDERLDARSAVHAERHAQRMSLRTRQQPDQILHRAQKSVQRGEGERRLRLQALGGQDLEAGAAVGDFVQQR